MYFVIGTIDSYVDNFSDNVVPNIGPVVNVSSFYTKRREKKYINITILIYTCSV